MEFDIIDKVKAAEESAAETLNAAREKAAGIISASEKRAAEIAAQCETDCAKLRAEILANAAKQAEAEYLRTVQAAQASAVAYADGILTHVEGEVSEIVGRLTK